MAASIQLTKAQFFCYGLAIASAGGNFAMASTAHPAAGAATYLTQVGTSLCILLFTFTASLNSNSRLVTPTMFKRCFPAVFLPFIAILMMLALNPVESSQPGQSRDHVRLWQYPLMPLAFAFTFMGLFTFAPRSPKSASVQPQSN